MTIRIEYREADFMSFHRLLLLLLYLSEIGTFGTLEPIFRMNENYICVLLMLKQGSKVPKVPIRI